MTRNETSTTAGATASDPVIVRGAATPEEVAALVAVLSAVGGSGDGSSGGDAASSVSAWAAPAATMRRPVGHGPGAWQNSLR
ncbi:hypothetical protein GCM10023153_22520 [Ornithinibacter aureus]|uniref:Acyl-CoA carboxylase subunit epsilon n=1 Tax=Ornithinibacter aureus TaxID=622664 RepID=A0ABP8JYD3_9MICO|nr:acyl-CoA carboxylase subunit epsilon [Ornithinibacter aureus]KAF0835402.1 acyl-CoA carboxylase epsilon subunit-like protein [Ornithinibacter aureus]